MQPIALPSSVVSLLRPVALSPSMLDVPVCQSARPMFLVSSPVHVCCPVAVSWPLMCAFVLTLFFSFALFCFSQGVSRQANDARCVTMTANGASIKSQNRTPQKRHFMRNLKICAIELQIYSVLFSQLCHSYSYPLH